MKRRLLRALLVLLVLVVIAAGYVWYQLQATLPPTSGTLQVAGVAAPVTITFDAMGIPQVWAQSEADAYFAVGWLHAGDRLFQMELARRSATGRLAELFGEPALELDVRQRRLGHARRAAQIVPELDEATRGLLQAYVDGVNTYIARDRLPFEFRLLGVGCEPWTVADVVALTGFQTWFTDSILERELAYQRIAAKVGEEKARSVIEAYPEWAPSTVVASPEIADLVRGVVGAQASNAWALGSERSASGSAQLASDPHGDVTALPGFLYLVGIHAADTGLDVVGATTPGMPVISMGHSRAIGWGVTAAGVDAKDFFRERLHPEHPDQYQTPDGWATFTRVPEPIKVKGREKPEELVVEISRHGPVWQRDEATGEVLTLDWTGLDRLTPASFAALFALPRATDWASFRAAAAELGAANLNFVYADAAGNIGYQMVAAVPIRPCADSRLPLPGEDGACDWQGYHPQDELPHVLNPAAGWVGNFNNRPQGDDLGYPLPGTYHPDRAWRFAELMSVHPAVDLSLSAELQLDVTDRLALTWRDEAVRRLEAQGHQDLAQLLRRWNGTMTADSKPAALINLWRAELARLIFEDELGTDMLPTVSREMVETVLGDADSPWIDDVRTPELETRDQLLDQALQRAVTAAADQAWGQIHHLTLRHPFARVLPFASLLGLQRGPYPASGSWGTLKASFNYRRQDGTFASVVAPMCRRIVDFGDVDGAHMVLPAGQSGNPMSPHFFDFFKLWQAGEYWMVPLTRERVEERAVSKLELVPVTVAEEMGQL